MSVRTSSGKKFRTRRGRSGLRKRYLSWRDRDCVREIVLRVVWCSAFLPSIPFFADVHICSGNSLLSLLAAILYLSVVANVMFLNLMRLSCHRPLHTSCPLDNRRHYVPGLYLGQRIAIQRLLFCVSQNLDIRITEAKLDHGQEVRNPC